MQKYEVGQTYTALICGNFHTFTVLTDDSEVDGTIGIQWDDCEDEEWDYPEEIDRWVQAARDMAEEERNS
ncbi:MAG: hypothetical protein K0Q87_4516 [Neobacillus sp.]|jgi:hypothetical protein|nr:hypothetical protein [Neobacillus sp.]